MRSGCCRYLRLLAQLKEHNEQTWDLLEDVLQRTEVYVQQIQIADNTRDEQPELEELEKTAPDRALEVRAEALVQRKVVRRDAQNASRNAAAVAIGMTKSWFLPEEDRQALQEHVTKYATKAKMAGMEMQVPPSPRLAQESHARDVDTKPPNRQFPPSSH